MALLYRFGEEHPCINAASVCPQCSQKSSTMTGQTGEALKNKHQCFRCCLYLGLVRMKGKFQTSVIFMETEFLLSDKVDLSELEVLEGISARNTLACPVVAGHGHQAWRSGCCCSFRQWFAPNTFSTALLQGGTECVSVPGKPESFLLVKESISKVIIQR